LKANSSSATRPTAYSASEPDDVRSLLRSLATLRGPYPLFDPDKAADRPDQQFLHWLTAAVAAGVSEPHAATLSTVGEDGGPDGRVLLLKDVGAKGWCFATSRRSVKGDQLTARPKAALTFYWPSMGRQVRVRGSVLDLGPDVGRADFLSRSRGARAVALLDRQSDVIASEETLESALSRANLQLDAEPEATSPSWAVYRVEPSTVEFWQADPERRHTRLQYVFDDGWRKRRLWP
jgi:pyridoxamine 5'-phosphate oxidase